MSRRDTGIMYKFRGYRGQQYPRYDNGNAPVVINTGSVNMSVTNVTKVTNVAYVSGTGYRSHSKRNGGGFGKQGRKDRSPRMPKFARYCLSGGLLESKAVARMNESDICREGFASLRYAKHNLSRGVSDAARGVCGMAEGVGKMAGAAFRLIGALFK